MNDAVEQSDAVTEDAQVQTDAPLEAFAQLVADRYWETDADHRLTYLGPGKKQLILDSREMVGKRLWEIDPELLSEDQTGLMAELFRREQAFRDFNYVRVFPDGHKMYASISAIPRYDKDGNFAGYAGTSNDVTEIKESEEKAEGYLQQVMYALEQMSTGIIVWDKDDRFLFCNSHYLKLHVEATEFLVPGIHLQEYLAQSSRSAHLGLTEKEQEEWVESRMPDPNRPVKDMEFHRKDGLWVSVRRQKLADGSTIVIHSDITEKKLLEKAKDEFLAVASHELRTPLTAIMGSLGLVKGGSIGKMGEQMEDMLEIAYRNCERLSRLIGDLLDLSKIEAGGLELSFETHDMAEIVQTALDLNAEYVSGKGAAIDWAGETDKFFVQVDRHRLIQVLTNLISNAAKFSPEKGIIKLEIDDGGGDNAVRVSVADQGPGISEEIREKIFEKFVQADTSDTRNVEGTGLGLAITKAIIESHGGRVWYESRAEGGAIFYFELAKTA